ncbi:MAG TPA: thiamine phosphate synthase [Patescibacteria group bacterium]|nr:thiamine phosphate synthase [Patescibacteria group bacterium]
MKYNLNCKLYLVTDRDMLKNTDFYTAIEQAIIGGVTLVQLREKNMTSLEFYHTALQVKKITDAYDVPLIINDRLDMMLAVDAAGVHLGQRDIPTAVARKLIGDSKILGASTATVEEAVLAQRDGADYIGVGALFGTTTKSNTRPVTVELLKQIKQSVSIPVVAIGGIKTNNVMQLKPANIDGVAVVSDILAREDIKSAAQEFRKLL